MASREKRTRTPSKSPIIEQLNSEQILPEKVDKPQVQPPIKRVRRNRLKSNIEHESETKTKVNENLESKAGSSKTLRRSTEPTDKRSQPNRLKPIPDSKTPRRVRSKAEIGKKKKLLTRKSLPIGTKAEKIGVGSATQRRSLPLRRTRSLKNEENSTQTDAEKAKAKDKSKLKEPSPISERLRRSIKPCDTLLASSVPKLTTTSSISSFALDQEPNLAETDLQKANDSENKSDILEQMAQNFSEINMPVTNLTTRRIGRPKKLSNKESIEDIKPNIVDTQDVSMTN